MDSPETPETLTTTIESSVQNTALSKDMNDTAASHNSKHAAESPQNDTGASGSTSAPESVQNMKFASPLNPKARSFAFSPAAAVFTPSSSTTPVAKPSAASNSTAKATTATKPSFSLKLTPGKEFVPSSSSFRTVSTASSPDGTAGGNGDEGGEGNDVDNVNDYFAASAAADEELTRDYSPDNPYKNFNPYAVVGFNPYQGGGGGGGEAGYNPYAEYNMYGYQEPQYQEHLPLPAGFPMELLYPQNEGYISIKKMLSMRDRFADQLPVEGQLVGSEDVLEAIYEPAIRLARMRKMRLEQTASELREQQQQQQRKLKPAPLRLPGGGGGVAPYPRGLESPALSRSTSVPVSPSKHKGNRKRKKKGGGGSRAFDMEEFRRQHMAQMAREAVGQGGRRKNVTDIRHNFKDGLKTPSPHGAGAGVGGGEGREGLLRAEHKWELKRRCLPASSISEGEAAVSAFRAILNKLSGRKFEPLVRGAEGVVMTEPSTLKAVVVELHSKAIQDSTFSSLYAQFCVALILSPLFAHPLLSPASGGGQGGGDDKRQPQGLRSLLLGLCYGLLMKEEDEDFSAAAGAAAVGVGRGFEEKEKIEGEEDKGKLQQERKEEEGQEAGQQAPAASEKAAEKVQEGKPGKESFKLSQADQEEQRLKTRDRHRGNLIFVCELFKQRLLHASAIEKIVEMYLDACFRCLEADPPAKPHEADLHAVSTCLDRCGKSLELRLFEQQQQGQGQRQGQGHGAVAIEVLPGARLSALYERVRVLSSSPLVSIRLRFKLQDVLDKRDKRGALRAFRRLAGHCSVL